MEEETGKGGKQRLGISAPAPTSDCHTEVLSTGK